MKPLLPSVRLRCGPRGLSLTEILVISFLAGALTLIMASTLGVFSSTTAVDLAADRVATGLREARYFAMAQGADVTPVILRDTAGGYTVVFAARALHMKGSLRRGELSLPLVDEQLPDGGQSLGDVETAGTVRQWTVNRYTFPDVDLSKGAFVYMVSSKPVDLNQPDAEQAWGELVYLRAQPGEGLTAQDAPAGRPAKVEILMRGVHNTALGHFTPETTGGEGVDGYVVVSGTPEPLDLGSPELDRAHLLDGYQLPAGTWLDQMPRADETDGLPRRVQATLTARAGVAFERTWRATGQVAYEAADTYPVYRPIFDSAGYVRPQERTGQNHDLQLALRIVDGTLGDRRYVVIRASDGLVTVHKNAPANLDAWGHPAELNFQGAVVQGRVEGADTSHKRLALPAEDPVAGDEAGTQREAPMPGVRAGTQIQGRVDAGSGQKRDDSDK